MVCTKEPLLVLIVEQRLTPEESGSANNATCLDNAFVCIQSLHLRIPPRVLHFSAIHFTSRHSGLQKTSISHHFNSFIMQRVIPILSPLVFMPSLYSSFHNSKNFLFTSIMCVYNMHSGVYIQYLCAYV